MSLDHFLKAQEPAYARVLKELRGGRKQSHWMWFIFPQHVGLGRSSTAQVYGLASLEEARVYLDHPLLGARLCECTELLLSLEGRTAKAIFGFPDDLKLRSSMTLFAVANGTDKDEDCLFQKVLDVFCGGQRDQLTLDLLDA